MISTPSRAGTSARLPVGPFPGGQIPIAVLVDDVPIGGSPFHLNVQQLDASLGQAASADEAAAADDACDEAAIFEACGRVAHRVKCPARGRRMAVIAGGADHGFGCG